MAQRKKTQAPVEAPIEETAAEIQPGHLKKCPADPNRVEQYDATRPNGERLRVYRCYDCGEAVYVSLDAPAEEIADGAEEEVEEEELEDLDTGDGDEDEDEE